MAATTQQPKITKNNIQQEDCEKWFENKEINPYTGKALKVTRTGTYAKLDKFCSKYSHNEAYEKWKRNRSVNPFTNKKIKTEGRVYRDLQELFKEIPPIKRRKSRVPDNEGKSKKKTTKQEPPPPPPPPGEETLEEIDPNDIRKWKPGTKRTINMVGGDFEGIVQEVDLSKRRVIQMVNGHRYQFRTSLEMNPNGKYSFEFVYPWQSGYTLEKTTLAHIRINKKDKGKPLVLGKNMTLILHNLNPAREDTAAWVESYDPNTGDIRLSVQVEGSARRPRARVLSVKDDQVQLEWNN